MDGLAQYAAPRDKLRRMCEQGLIYQVRRGLYLSSWARDQLETPMVLAPLVYGPSYVSHETALAHYGIIPERVAEITCTTSKRAKYYDTPLGRFRYFPLNDEAFSFGYRSEPSAQGNYLIAEPEKALCDRIARVKGLTAMKEVPALLFEDLRIAPDSLKSLRSDFIQEIAARYRKNNLKLFSRWFQREFG